MANTIRRCVSLGPPIEWEVIADDATYVKLDGSTPMTGALTLPGDPTLALHASTKDYVDTQIASGVVSATYTTIANVNSFGGVGKTVSSRPIGAGNTGGYTKYVSVAFQLINSTGSAILDGGTAFATLPGGFRPRAGETVYLVGAVRANGNPIITSIVISASGNVQIQAGTDDWPDTTLLVVTGGFFTA